MQRDQYNHISHFLEDAGFREWVLSGKDSENWAGWLEKATHQSQVANEARILLLAIGGQGEAHDEADTEVALSGTWSQIHENAKRSFIKSSAFWRKCAAALVLITLGVSWQFYTSARQDRELEAKSKSSVGNISDVRIYNHTDGLKTISLEDGSSVVLQPGSLLSHPSVFDSVAREVYLSGEAFFEVSKDRKKPFLVYTNHIVTRVVGTSFTINAMEDLPNVEVFVKTGQVNVRQLKTEDEKDAPEEIALQQNESASFVKAVNTFEKVTVRDASRRPAESLSFEFVDTPVARIFQSIEKAYGLPVEFPRNLLKECYLSTSLSDEPLLEKLKIICESLGEGSSFSVGADRIKITSNGCN